MSNRRMSKGNAKKKNRIKKLIFLLVVITLMLGAGSSFIVLLQKKQIVIEAGEIPDMDPASYFRASDIALPFLQLKKGVGNCRKVGKDTIEFSYLHFFHFTVDVIVEDHTSPQFELTKSDWGIEPGTTLEAANLISSLSDNADGTLTVSFANRDADILFDSYGIFEDMICVADESGNMAQKPIKVWVADAPQIAAPSVYYVAQSSEDYEMDAFLKSVSVTDPNNQDEIVKPTISIDEFDSNMQGDYIAKIKACNSYHVASEIKVPVHVVPEEKLTEMLMADQNALFTGEVITKDTGNELEHMKQADLLGTEQMVQPTLASIYYTLANGGYAYGNGFVIDLTEDSVYIASNYHVLAGFEGQSAKITFYSEEAVDNYTFLGGSKEYDVAFVKIDRAAISDELYNYLREPKISLARAYTIKEGEALFRTSCFINKPNHTEEGKFDTYEKQIFNGSEYTTFTLKINQGDSGTAIYDAYGYLISMCAGVSHEETSDIMCGVRLDKIVSEYEKCSGNKLYAF